MTHKTIPILKLAILIMLNVLMIGMASRLHAPVSRSPAAQSCHAAHSVIKCIGGHTFYA